MAEFDTQPRKKRNQSEFKTLKAKNLSRIKQQLLKTLNVSSKISFFWDFITRGSWYIVKTCGIYNVPRTTSYKVLKQFAKIKS